MDIDSNIFLTIDTNNEVMMKIIIHLKLQYLLMYKDRTQNQLPIDTGFLSKCQTGAFGMAPMSLVEIQSVELNLEL